MTFVLRINGWGNLGGIIGSELYKPRYGPDYHFPLKIAAGLIGVAWVGDAASYFELRFANRYKARKIAQMTHEEIKEKSGMTKGTRIGNIHLCIRYRVHKVRESFEGSVWEKGHS